MDRIGHSGGVSREVCHTTSELNTDPHNCTLLNSVLSPGSMGAETFWHMWGAVKMVYKEPNKKYN